MELRQLHTFRTIATLGSFSLAAEALNYAQSTVSEQIKALESDLNVRLFNRDGKNVFLTTAGELLLQYSLKMLNLEEEIRTEINACEEVRGSLSLRIPETISSFYLPAILKKFHARFPRVDFNLNHCTPYGLHRELRSGIINMAFLITDAFHEADLETLRLRDVPIVLATYPGNPLVSGRSIALSDLAGQPMFRATSDCSYFKMIEKRLTREKVVLPVIMRVNSVEAVKRNIMAGTGVGVFPEISVRRELSEGSLVELPLQGEPIVAGVVMIWLKNKWHPPILEAFIAMAKEVLSSDNDTEP